MRELKPCPFCGGKAVLNDFPRLLSPYVICSNCQVRTWGIFDDVDTVVSIWNDRHEQTCTYDEGEDYHLTCSACGWDRRGALIIPNYCPHCGAKVMNASNEEEYDTHHRFLEVVDGD